MKKAVRGGLHYFEDGGDAGSDSGDAGSADAGVGPGSDANTDSSSADAVNGMDAASDAAAAAAAADAAAAANAPGGANFGADIGYGDVMGSSGVTGPAGQDGANAPGGASFGADIGFGPVASQGGLGVIGSGPVSADGYTLGELQNMQANGLGNQDLGNQTVNQAIAALGVSSITPGQIASALGFISPPLGAAISSANTVMGLISGQTTVGQAVASLGLNAVAQAIGVSPSTLAGVVNMNPGQTIASLTGPVGNAVSGALGLMSPGTSLASAINSALGTTPSGQTNTSAIASAINSAIGSGQTASAPSSGVTTAGTSEPSLSTPSESTSVAGAPSSGGFSDSLGSILGGLATAGLGGMALAGSNYSPWLNTDVQALKTADNTKPKEVLKLAELKDIYDKISPDLLDILVARGAIPAAAGGTIGRYASGSSVSDSPLWGAMGNLAPKFVPATSTTISTGPARRQKLELAPLKPISDTLAQGGLPSKYREAAPKGHNPEFITGLTGFYANGRGTGQSDDIPAMLHDGDYVMDADTVAALGDGSSKAGALALEGLRREVPHRMSEGGNAVPAKIADGEYVFPEAFVTALGNGDNKRGAKMLDTIRENLRAHKRSAPTSKIPPKALSPLDYLNKSKG